MKTVSTDLGTHFGLGCTTLAYLWKVKRVDGTILGFTTHDVAIAYDDGVGDGSTTYLATSGFTNTAMAGKADLSVDNAEVTGFLRSDSILDADLRSGLYDEATIWVRIVNWADLTMGDLLLRTGTLGVVKMKNGIFTAELRGLNYKLTTLLGDTFGPICRAPFGSPNNGISPNTKWKCNIDTSTYTQSGSVNTSADAVTIVPTAGLLQVGSATPSNPAPADWFDDGFIEFTSGVLDGQAFEIKSWDGTTLGLYLPMPAAPAHADTFSIVPGCNHTTNDCFTKYNNIVNFRGENTMPGRDKILNYPNAQN